MFVRNSSPFWHINAVQNPLILVRSKYSYTRIASSPVNETFISRKQLAIPRFFRNTSTANERSDALNGWSATYFIDKRWCEQTASMLDRSGCGSREFRADVFQRFDECVFKLRRDCQRLPTKHGSKAQSGCVSLDFIEYFHLRSKALVSEKRVDKEKTTRSCRECGTRASGGVWLARF